MFNWTDFTTLLNPSVIAMTASIGLAFGFIVVSINHRGSLLFYWMAVSGVLLFVPLTVIRWLQHSDVWERWLSILVLWLIYSGAAYWGDRLHRWLFTRKP